MLKKYEELMRKMHRISEENYNQPLKEEIIAELQIVFIELCQIQEEMISEGIDFTDLEIYSCLEGEEFDAMIEWEERVLNLINHRMGATNSFELN